MHTGVNVAKKKKNSFDITIFIFIFLIAVVLILLLTSKEDKIETPTNNEQTDPTPQQPTPPSSNSILTLSLKGDKQVIVIKGQEYKEPGYTAHDSVEGDLTNRVTMEGKVDTTVVGTYTITYKVVNSEKIKTERTRTIKVIEDLDVTVDYSPKDLTNSEVTISIKITGDCLSSIQLPNGSVTQNKTVDYKVTSNNEYTFIIRRIDGSTIEKKVKIDNIDKKKPTGTCKNTIDNGKTTIVVNASDDGSIKKYEYTFNGKSKDSTSNTFTINEVASSVTVTIYDKAGNTNKITCQKIDESWPVIKEQNYQSHSAKNYNQNLRYNGMNYIIYYPDNMSLNTKHPLVIHLHGLGEFGSNIQNTLAGSSAFTNNMKQGKFQQQAIFLAPQCSAGSKKWTACFDNLKGLIDKVVREYNVDTNRITMTGHSLGGQAVFDFIVRYPGFLAAAAPLSPSYPWNHDYTKMKNMKIAVFLGTAEPLYERDQPEIEYLQKNGVNLKQFGLQGITHSSQKAFYNGTNIIDWLITQSK